LEISIGNYILSGGESAALVIIDAISRLLPGVLAKKESITNETFEDKILKYPQYTRPEKYKNLDVPKVLLSGDHKQIKTWQTQMAKKITLKKRPDLLKDN
jgi:tRNA (guanine37-N1)-methyltransferase